MTARIRALAVAWAGSALLAACAPTVSPLRDGSAHSVERIRSSGVADVFPEQYRDLVGTHARGELLYRGGDLPGAERYFSFAMTKADLMESAYLDESKRRELAARAEAEHLARIEREKEEQRQAEARRAAEMEAAIRAAEETRAAARRAEAERVEVRRRARLEREQPLPTRHTVKRGETLPQIAALPDVYGDSTLWPLLYRANRDQIRDPRILWPGQQLRIPRNLDRSDLAEARRYSSDRPLR